MSKREVWRSVRRLLQEAWTNGVAVDLSEAEDSSSVSLSKLFWPSP